MTMQGSQRLFTMLAGVAFLALLAPAARAACDGDADQHGVCCLSGCGHSHAPRPRRQPDPAPALRGQAMDDDMRVGTTCAEQPALAGGTYATCGRAVIYGSIRNKDGDFLWQGADRMGAVFTQPGAP